LLWSQGNVSALPRLTANQCDGQQEGSSRLESHGKYLCTITRIQWCFRRGCDDSITVAFIKTQSEQFTAVLLAFIGAIYVGFGLQTGTRTQIITEWTVALGFFWRGNGGSLGHSLDRSSRLCRARILGLCASSKFKARADTFVVSAILRRLGLGGSGDFDHYWGLHA